MTCKNTTHIICTIIVSLILLWIGFPILEAILSVIILVMIVSATIIGLAILLTGNHDHHDKGHTADHDVIYDMG